MRIKNAIVMATSAGCECDTWMLVMSALKEKVGIHPRYLIYYNDKKLQKGKDKFLAEVGENVFFHHEFDNFKGRGYPATKKYNVLDSQLLHSISSYELIALKMMDRFDPLDNAFSFTNRQYYFRKLVLKWLDIIDEMSIDIFISPDIPHRVSDYALYVACRIKKIEFIYFDLTPFGDASLINDSITDYDADLFDLEGSVQVNANEEAITSKLNSCRGQKDDYKLWYMEEQDERANINIQTKAMKSAGRFLKSKWLYRPVSAFNNTFISNHFSFYVKPHTMPYDSDFKLVDKRIIDSKVNKKANGYLPLYNALVEQVDLTQMEYVIFALHHQPEATTSPSGDVFVDQLLVIDMLDRLLPPHINILVKDHKSQFLGVLESPSAGRSQVFYERFNEFSDRVKAVPLSLNAFDLIDHAKAVVTVTGTIGIESLARGKPVFCFGRTWYQHCKGAFRIKNEDDVLSAWHSINNDFNISDEDVDAYVAKVAKHFVWGLHSGAYRKISHRSQQETVTNVVSGITHFLKNKNFV